MSKETRELLRRIANERNISVEILEEAVESAIVSAARKRLDPDLEISRACIDPQSGEYHVFATKQIVHEVNNDATEISLAEARLYNIDAELGTAIELDVTPADFGRIAAQNAKQVVNQRIREAEREMVFERYSGRVGELVSGSVQQFDRGNIIIDIGYAEAVLPYGEQSRTERFHFGDRVRAVIIDVTQSNRDAQVILSRRSPQLVAKLFEQEVSEVRDGTVVVRGVSRESGRRSKIAVSSNNLDVDPVGACVGMKGSRVQMVVQELRGERIDIIPYSKDPAKYVGNAMKPAEVESVEMDPTGTRATIVVRDDQLSLAIGKNGMNVRLASELTGMQIDVLSLSEIEASERETRNMLGSLPGVDLELAENMMQVGIFGYEDIQEFGVEGLVETINVTPEIAGAMVEAAEQFLSGEETPAYLDGVDVFAVPEEDDDEMATVEPVQVESDELPLEEGLVEELSIEGHEEDEVSEEKTEG